MVKPNKNSTICQFINMGAGFNGNGCSPRFEDEPISRAIQDKTFFLRGPLSRDGVSGFFQAPSFFSHHAPGAMGAIIFFQRIKIHINTAVLAQNLLEDKIVNTWRGGM